MPIAVSVELPDLITEDTFFTVTTDKLTHMLGANITANAPSFGAQLDGVFDVANEFIGEACVLGACTGGTFNADVNLGSFELLALDSTSPTPWTLFGEFAVPVEFLGKKTIRAPTPDNPDGIDEFGTPPVLKPPILIEAELKGLQDKSCIFGKRAENGP